MRLDDSDYYYITLKNFVDFLVALGLSHQIESFTLDQESYRTALNALNDTEAAQDAERARANVAANVYDLINDVYGAIVDANNSTISISSSDSMSSMIVNSDFGMVLSSLENPESDSEYANSNMSYLGSHSSLT